MTIWRRLLAVCVVIFAGCAFAQPSPQPGPGHAIEPASRQHDVYAIYSLLMPGAVFANMGPSQNQRWAIADTTVSAEDINPAIAPEAALKAPDDHPRRFHDAVVDYEQRRNERQAITHHLHLDRPYTLLSQAEVEEFRAARAAPNASNSLRQKYSGYPGINYFSDVYFDMHRSVALVYRLDWCGNLCSQGEWIYAEKHNGRWIERSGQAGIVSGARPF